MQIDLIIVIYFIFEDNLFKVMLCLQFGDKLQVEVWDCGQIMQFVCGVFMMVDNIIDNIIGMVKLCVQFLNQNVMLFLNQFVNVCMWVDMLCDVVIVLGVVIQCGMQGIFVYVVGDDNKVVLCVVKLGVIEGECVLVV